MKVENIKKLNNGNVSCTLNGIILTGTLESVNQILIANGEKALWFEPQHWSETKQEWIPVNTMAAKHIENHLVKRGIFYDYEIKELKNNEDNRRDYMRRLISIYDNYDKK